MPKRCKEKRIIGGAYEWRCQKDAHGVEEGKSEMAAEQHYFKPFPRKKNTP